MNEGIVCPNCDYVHEDWWEYVEPTVEDAEFQMPCEDCCLNFYVSMYTKITFKTNKM